MELKEFIKTSVTEITAAIKELKNEHNSSLQKSNVNFEQNPIAPDYKNLNGNQKNRSIDFDIAVVSSENETKFQGGKIGIKVVGGEMTNSSAATKENSSRIKFSIPFYPEYIS